MRNNPLLGIRMDKDSNNYLKDIRDDFRAIRKHVDFFSELAKKEIEKAKDYDYIIVNDQLDKAYEELKSIIIKEEKKNGYINNQLTRMWLKHTMNYESIYLKIKLF